MKKITYQSFQELPVVMMVPDMANVLGIGLTKAYEISKEKGFPCLRLGSRILIPRDRFIRWINEKTSQSSVLL